MISNRILADKSMHEMDYAANQLNAKRPQDFKALWTNVKNTIQFEMIVPNLIAVEEQLTKQLHLMRINYLKDINLECNVINPHKTKLIISLRDWRLHYIPVPVPKLGRIYTSPMQITNKIKMGE